MKPELTNRESQVLEYMVKILKQKGYPPTVREMCNSLGIKSTSTAHKDLSNLEKKGYIKKDPTKPRAIEILDYDIKYKQNNESFGVYEKFKNLVEIPVVGTVTAGQPILAQENIESTFPISANYIGNGNYFMLTVKGESMIEAGILDGDYILVKQQQTANNGDIVVAMIDNFESEATVKRFFKEDNHIRLQPENSALKPIIVDNASILGLVKGVFRLL